MRKEKRPVTNWDDVPIVFDLYFAAGLLGVDYRTAQRYHKRGILPGTQAVKNGIVWVSKEALRNWLEPEREREQILRIAE